MANKKKEVAEVMSVGAKIQRINDNKRYKKLWNLLTMLERRQAIEESDDLWHFDEVCQDIIDSRK